MANTRDFTGKNRQFTGTKGIVLPKGTTGERVDTEGEIRFNTSLQLAEYYDGTAWKSIDAPPTISSITGGTNLAADGSTTHTVTVNGSNFSLGCTVQFIGNTGTLYSATNVNRVNGTQVTCKTTATMGTGDDPYSVRLNNTSGLSFTLADSVTFNAVPNAGANFLGLIWTGRVVSGSSLNASTTDPEGDTITYSVVPGYALPSGLSISSSTGYITGTAGSITEGQNYVFKIRASTSNGSTDYQCFVTGSSATITSSVLMVGGGGGGNNYSGGGGAGEVIFISRGLARGTTFPLVVGGGGPGRQASGAAGIDGAGTTTTGFSETVKRGGGGHGSDGSQSPSAQVSSGEGGGSRSGGAGGTQGTSVGTGVTRYGGYSGGTGSCAPYYPGAGGGGAGGNGVSAPNTSGPSGAGGVGVNLDISGTPYFWGGGGGGGSHTTGNGGAGGNGGGGGGGANSGGSGSSGGAGFNPGQAGIGPSSPYKGGNAGANTGGGGGSGPRDAGDGGTGANVNGGNGGTGIVVVRYASATTQATGGTVSSYSQGGTTYQVHTFTTSGNFITN
jgi:hypothetical protein